MAERSVLELILRSRKTGSGAKDASSDLRKFRGEANKAEAAAKKLKLGLKAAEGAAIAAGLAFIRSVPDLVDLGLEAQRAEVALEAMAGGSEQAAAALEGVQRGAGGALDRLTAMQNATRLFSMGLASNAEEAEKLTDIAITLGATMGRGPQQAFEEFTLLLANQSILRLDTFGISAGRVRERMNELAEVMPDADRQTRFLTATMEEAEAKMAALDEAGFEATGSVDRMRAIIEDAKLGVATFLSEGLVPWFDLLFKGHDALVEHEQQVRLTADSYDAYVTEMERANDASGPLIKNVDIVSEGMFNASRIAAEGTAPIDGWAIAMQNAAAAAGDAAGAAGGAAAKISALVVGTRELNAAAIGQEGLKALNSALQEGVIGQEEYDLAAREIMSTLLGLPKAQIDANFALRELISGFEEGAVGADPLVTQLQVLNAELSKVQDVEATVTINLEGAGAALMTGGGEFAFQHGGRFMVGGLPGPDRNFVAFRATRGEMVTVTPAAGTPPQAVNNLEFGRHMTVIVQNGDDERLFLDKLRRAARRL